MLSCAVRARPARPEERAGSRTARNRRLGIAHFAGALEFHRRLPRLARGHRRGPATSVPEDLAHGELVLPESLLAEGKTRGPLTK